MPIFRPEADLNFRWPGNPRFAPDAAVVAASVEEQRFLPVEIVVEAKAPAAGLVAENRIEIGLAGRHRVRIGGSHDPQSPARLVRGLAV